MDSGILYAPTYPGFFYIYTGDVMRSFEEKIWFGLWSRYYTNVISNFYPSEQRARLKSDFGVCYMNSTSKLEFMQTYPEYLSKNWGEMKPPVRDLNRDPMHYTTDISGFGITYEVGVR